MLDIPKQYNSLKFVKSISWMDIFDVWREGEARQESWKKHWEERGYNSWEEWRKNYAAPLQPEKLQWFLYNIKNPVKDLPFFYGVPSRSWIEKAYQGEITEQLKDLIDLPIARDNPKVADIKKNFPEKTMLTGLVYDEKIILVEGMHRALALASWDSKTPLENEVTIALASWGKKDIPAIGSGSKGK